MAIFLPAIMSVFYLGLHRSEQLHSPVVRRLLFFPPQKKNTLCAELCLVVAKNKGTNESF